MRYHALATDYDGTLATRGHVDAPTLEALARCRASGREIILVTGRELEDLERVMPELDRFTRIVAENGALLYDPAARRERMLAERAPEALVRALRAGGVTPLSVGRVIVATREPHEGEVLRAIRDLGLEHEVIFNKGAVMVLPSGVNKAFGLRAALEELGLSPHNVVSVGDAENDHAFLAASECGVAVANALPSLKEQADFVTERDHGAGVVELIDHLMRDDLREADARLARHDVVIGAGLDGTPIRLSPQRESLLVAGASGEGKSTLAMAIVERLLAARYDCCIVDPEGEHDRIEGAVTLGDASHAPGTAEARQLLERPGTSCVLNFIAVPPADRPACLERMASVVRDLRSRTGRPHWVLFDEAHHVLPSGWTHAAGVLPAERVGLGFVTVRPETVSREALEAVSMVVGVGARPMDPIRSVAALVDAAVPAEPARPAEAAGDAVLLWRRSSDGTGTLEWCVPVAPHAAHRRHVRKYAEGTLSPERSFYFRGPDGRLSLRAPNLATFVDLARGVDDDTWDFHLRRGDYEQWFRSAIKDDALANAAGAIAADRSLSPAESRERVATAIADRYTAPA